MRSVFCLLSLLFLTSITVLAAPTFARYPDVSVARRAFNMGGARETNAQRMKRGLNPRRPDRLFSPTRVRRDPLPSSVPVIPIKIKLVKKSDGSTSGYMQTSYDPISLTEDGGVRFLLDSPFGASPSRKFEILYDGSADPDYSGRRLALYGNGPTAVGEGLPSTLNFYSPWSPTPEGSIQVSDGYVKYESTIWSVDPSTGFISAQWVNPDRTTAPLKFFQNDAGGDAPFAGATGDIQASKDAYPELGIEEVTLVAVPVTIPDPGEPEYE